MQMGPWGACWLPDRQQRRLRRMAGPAGAGAPRGQPCHDAAGVPCPLAADAKRIGTAAQDASALQAWRARLRTPCLKDLLETARGPSGGTGSPWYDASVRL